jgi:hypothetical protein
MPLLFYFPMILWLGMFEVTRECPRKNQAPE